MSVIRALLIVSTGCYSTTHVRYVHVPEPPAQARAELDKRALKSGASAHVDMHFVPEGTGSLVELTTSKESSLDEVAIGGTTYHSIDEPGLGLEGLYNDLVVDAGIGFAPHSDAWWRIDAMAHVGQWLWNGDAERYLAPRTRVAIIGGLGAAIDENVAFRPEVGIRIERQDAITRIDGRVATHGRRKAFTLAFSTPVATDYYALEGSATLEVAPYGGIFTRVGYEKTDDDGDGMTFLAGYRVDTSITFGTIKGVAIAVVGAALVYLAYSSGKL
jgi:hypothetical protein